MSWCIALHGGAGTMPVAAMTDAVAAEYRAALLACLAAGQAVLAAGGAALDAVLVTVCALEDDDRFNAGRGAVLTADGTVEHDAAVMRGTDRAFGAVLGIRGPRNPIRAADVVRRLGGPVMLAGAGAMRVLRESGLPMEPDAYFITDRRRAALGAELARRASGDTAPADDFSRHGTVGCVALDVSGGLAAGTSTGGLTGKLPGRIGDTPVPGAGVWADSACAVSCTGTGEVFLRHAAAHEIAARLRWAGQDIATAAGDVIAELAADGGEGGLIAMDARGRVAMPFSSRGMYRAAASDRVAATTGIFAD